MIKRPDPLFVALLATLEDRARTNGDKSIVKGVVKKLTLAGADAALIAEIAVLRAKKIRPAKVAKAKIPTGQKQAPEAKTKSAHGSPKGRLRKTGQREMVVPV